MRAYFEEYKCGCVSAYIQRKRDLLGYCGKHGDDCRHVHVVDITREEADAAQWEKPKRRSHREGAGEP